MAHKLFCHKNNSNNILITETRARHNFGIKQYCSPELTKTNLCWFLQDVLMLIWSSSLCLLAAQNSHKAFCVGQHLTYLPRFLLHSELELEGLQNTNKNNNIVCLFFVAIHIIFIIKQALELPLLKLTMRGNNEGFQEKQLIVITNVFTPKLILKATAYTTPQPLTLTQMSRKHTPRSCLSFIKFNWVTCVYSIFLVTSVQIQGIESCSCLWRRHWSSQFYTQLKQKKKHHNCLSSLCNCDDQYYSLYLSSQFKNMIFLIFICILHHLRVYYDELTKWAAPSWPDSSVGRALHQYCRGHWFESHSSLKFFQA